MPGELAHGLALLEVLLVGGDEQRGALEVGEVALDRVDVLAHDRVVARLLPQDIGDLHEGGIPGRALPAAHEGGGDGLEGRGVDGKRPVTALLVAQGAQPVAVEAVHVGVVGGRGREHLRVARPAHALVALRAVGGQAQEVGRLGVLHVLEQARDELVGALVGGGHVDGRELHELHVLGGQGLLEAGHLDVAAAAVGEVRLEDLVAGGRGVEVRNHGGTQVLHHHGADQTGVLVLLEVGIEDLREADDDLVALVHVVGRDREALDAHHVLAHIVDVGAGAFLGLPEALDGRQLTDRVALGVEAGAELEFVLARLEHHGLRPARIVEAGLVPARKCRRRTGVVALAVEVAGGAHGTLV